MGSRRAHPGVPTPRRRRPLWIPSLLLAPFSRIALRRSAAGRRLAPVQEVLLAGALVAAIGTAALVLVAGARLARRADPDGAPAIEWRCEIAEPPASSPVYAVAEPGNGGEGRRMPALPAIPRFDAGDPSNRLRAASLAALAGDLREATGILPAGDPDRPGLLEISGARHAAVLGALDAALAAREAAPGEPADPAGEKPPPAVEAPSRIALLGRLGQGASDGDLLRAVLDLHREIRERAGASDAHARLLLDSAFPLRSPARKLYREAGRPGAAPAAGPEAPKGAP